MGKENTVRQVAKKEYNWYGSVGVPVGVYNVNVLARVESIRPQLLENSVLRVGVLVRLFVILPKNGVEPDHDLACKKITKDIDTTFFVQLRRVQDFENIVSIHHRISVDKVSVRMGRVSVVGTLGLDVTYLGYVILEGMVSEFPRNTPVRGAAVHVKELDGGEVLHSTTTDKNGQYVFNEIDPGTYRVIVEAEGYEGGEDVAVVMLHDEVNFILHRT
ncbi:carboxypeptidase-like regulatory domain-containing protein [Desulfoscipio geothermicus]|uniref:Carboxypeptidase regulatory-like domain-containing protein n=1 Tax=Desulfoscipio geothermicus DSM 3669 TaxID=1121426 RepID=A0A1I6DRZ5_9FIRM|nr:carboxypeptidase-like regulatory domain-containing protein [Desulfoscipio geothermicus]SFR08233.1 Carboxypeptidase regulatory-like domain-containing protein [Desulfoscipio geothermicus DSM 3669]